MASLAVNKQTCSWSHGPQYIHSQLQETRQKAHTFCSSQSLHISHSDLKLHNFQTRGVGRNCKGLCKHRMLPKLLEGKRKYGEPFIGASSNGVDNAQPAMTAQEWPLPTTSDVSVEQARGACQRAIADGKTRLQIELLLPLIGATDLDDWPGGIKQQFKAAVPLVYSLLRELVGTSSAEASKKNLLDEADAVGVWESNSVALVLFPNADTVPELTRLAEKEGRPLLIMNPQWQAGQVISDFGFGARRRDSEDFLASFEPAYLLQQKRIQGEDVRILRCYPGPYQVYLTDDSGKSVVVTTSEVMPTYKEIDTLLRARVGSRASKGWLEKLMGETKFNLENRL